MKKWKIVVALVVAIALLAGVLIFIFGRKPAEPDDLPTGTTAATTEQNREEEGEGSTEPEAPTEKEDDKKEEEETEATEETQVAKQNSGIALSGTGSGNSFDISMSDSYTFMDPAGLSYGTRYVLYGGSDCMFARTASAQGYSCIGGYEVLYASGASPICEYRCYVMSSVGDAQGLAGYFANYYNGGDTSCGRNGDVVYIYYAGSYVQDTIDIYYDQGVIDSPSVEAYLRIPFFFNGMSAYTGGAAPEKKPEEGKGEETPTPQPTPSEGDKGFSLKVTGSYTFKDPEGLSFDTRYVLCGGADCASAATVSKAAGVSINKLYEILYTKNGEAAAEYQLYVTGSAAEAKAVADLYQNGWTAVGNVAISASDAATVQQTISYLSYVGVETTVAGYLRYMMTTGGMSNYSGTDIPPETEPDEKPTDPTNPDPTEPDPEPEFELKDPAGLDYDTRYILSGDSSNGFAAQYGAEKVYVVFYAKDGAPLGQYMYYVMDSAASAESLAAANDGWTTDNNAACTNYDGAYVQDYIDIYSQYGMISEATLDAYVKLFESGYGLTLEDAILPNPEPVFELKDPAGLDYDTRYILSGDSSNGFAAQYGAEKVYVVFYAKDGAPLGQYMYYVMDSAASAENLAAANEGWTTDNNAACTNYDGAYVQDYIDIYAQYGMIGEATLDAYVKLLESGYGLTLEDTILPHPELEGIKITDSYYFADPDGINYDTRYVLHGDSTSAMAGAAGAQAADVILYVKDGQPMGQYEFYVMADAETAAQMAAQVGGKAIGNVVCGESDGAKVSASIEMFAGFGMIPEPTVEAYVAYYTGSFGLAQTEDTILPEPDPEPEIDPNAIQMSDSFTFTDPEDLSYDTRYVLHGDSSVAAQAANVTGTTITDAYEILYVKDNVPVREFQCYVTMDNAAAQKIAGIYQNGMKAEGNVAVMENSAEIVQQTIGFLTYLGQEATLEGYVRYMMVSGYAYYGNSARLPEAPAATEPEEKPVEQAPAAEQSTNEAAPEAEATEDPADEPAEKPAAPAEVVLPEPPATEPAEAPREEATPKPSEDDGTEQEGCPEETPEAAPEETPEA